ncbi:VPS28 protein-domain-containing protein [Endogone sp. FLAS-F59071]|nr:VPS28 protein-domain-containing protein [Endogone sp. FLAS-F59071]|eukprot:RUS17532.1 VPS28 protein-domain-containing protein [Endogone sp. FLAS-F59071]
MTSCIPVPRMYLETVFSHGQSIRRSGEMTSRAVRVTCVCRSNFAATREPNDLWKVNHSSAMQQQQQAAFSYLQPYSPVERRPSISLDEEVKLYTNNKDREKYDNMADLFGIIILMEHLEKAYIRDSITHDEYTPACTNLIAKYKTALNLVSDSVPDLEKFMRDYKLACPAAANRLKIGVPATYEHAVGENYDSGKSAKYVAETVQHFITLMDALKLNLLAVDQLHPILVDLIQSLNNVTSLPSEFDGRAKVRTWLIRLNQMKASDEITEEQARQMLFEMEQAHTEFYRSLSEGAGK